MITEDEKFVKVCLYSCKASLQFDEIFEKKKNLCSNSTNLRFGKYLRNNETNWQFLRSFPLQLRGQSNLVKFFWRSCSFLQNPYKASSIDVLKLFYPTPFRFLSCAILAILAILLHHVTELHVCPTKVGVVPVAFRGFYTTRLTYIIFIVHLAGQRLLSSFGVLYERNE